MTSQEFRKLAGASYDMRFKSEKVRKEINDLESILEIKISYNLETGLEIL